MIGHARNTCRPLVIAAIALFAITSAAPSAHAGPQTSWSPGDAEAGELPQVSTGPSPSEEIGWPSSPSWAPEDISPNSLRLTRSGSNLHLTWGAASAPYAIYRASSPIGLTRRSNHMASTPSLFYDDPLSGLPGSIYYYAVGDPARCLDAEACNGVDDTCDGQVDEGLSTFTCGIGACARTVPACVGGALQACVLGTPSPESCDGIDNDCDGGIDEDGCNCVYVSPLGIDTNPGTTTNPMRTIQAAISRAATTGPPRVCVAATQTCVQANYDESVVMANGVSVYGGYQHFGSTWPRPVGCITRIRVPSATPAGVLFPNTVQSMTILDGFTVDAAVGQVTAAAITVDGATGASLNNLVVTGAGSTNSYGVSLIHDGQATITNSLITGGAGTNESVGVRAVGSRPIIRRNCSNFDAGGRCTSVCTTRGIRARSSGTGTTSYSVYLEDSPNSIVDSSALCNVVASQAAGLRIVGSGAGTLVHGNNIAASIGQSTAYGIWLEDCSGTAPWVVDNWNIVALGGTVNSRVDGVHAVGDCHPIIDQNVRIVGSAEGQNALESNGVFCGANASGIASRCAVINNPTILGSAAGFPQASTGVRCLGGSCWRIQKNFINGRAGTATYGLQLEASGPLVDNNSINGGCAVSVSVGVFSRDAWSRLQNNRITPGSCVVSPFTPTTYGMQVIASAGTVELDVHSNDLDGGRNSSASCTSAGLYLDVGAAPPAAGVGMYRNNIIRAGECATRYNVREGHGSADPRIFLNNDLDPFPLNPPTALYLNENSTLLMTPAAVNGLGDMTVGGVISADALYVSYPTDLHLQAGSPCVNAGTPAGAPTKDMDGAPRDAAPDIGADER